MAHRPRIHYQGALSAIIFDISSVLSALLFEVPKKLPTTVPASVANDPRQSVMIRSDQRVLEMATCIKNNAVKRIFVFKK